MANTGVMELKSASGPYAQSFGGLANNTCYSNPGDFDIKNVAGFIDKETLGAAFSAGVVQMKATGATAGGAGTAGYAMVPIHVDPRVTDRTRKYTPIVELIPRVSNQGTYADYNVITAKGGAFTANEDAALSETDTTYDRASTAIKYLYSVGRVTGQSIAAFPAYMVMGQQPVGGATGPFSDAGAPNSKQLEVLNKTREMRELEENLIINGNAGSDATQFSGIITLMGSTNTVGKSTSALKLTDIDLAIQYAFDDSGRPNLSICSSGVYTDLIGLLQAKVGYMQSTQQVFWGFSTIVLNTMVGQIPVIPSQYMSNVSGSKAIYFMDMSVVEMRVLQDLTYFELAKTNDSEKFALKIYEALIIKATQFCSSVTAISA